jgi:hypothetical protein
VWTFCRTEKLLPLSRLGNPDPPARSLVAVVAIEIEIAAAAAVVVVVVVVVAVVVVTSVWTCYYINVTTVFPSIKLLTLPLSQ